MDIAQEMLTTFNYDPVLLKKFITGDELCMYGYDIETKAQSAHPMEASRRAKTEKNMPVKCEGFAHCFPRLQWHAAS